MAAMTASSCSRVYSITGNIAARISSLPSTMPPSFSANRAASVLFPVPGNPAMTISTRTSLLLARFDQVFAKFPRTPQAAADAPAAIVHRRIDVDENEIFPHPPAADDHFAERVDDVAVAVADT